MLKERHRCGVRAAGSRGGALHRPNGIAPPEVGIIPGNRFLLLPLRKVSAFVRHHEHHCCGASATSTKTCIESKPLPSHRPTTTPPTNTVPHTNIKTSRASNNRHIVRQRRRQLAIAKTPLGPIAEQEEVGKPLLEDPGNKPWKRATSHMARIQKLQNLERAENARRINTLHYFRKSAKQEDSSRRCSHHSAPTHVDVPTRLAFTTSVTSKHWSHNPRRANGISVFTLDHPLEDSMQKRGTRVVSNKRLSDESESVVESEPEGMVGEKGQKKVRSLVAFGKNRVSPSDHQILGLPSAVFLENPFGKGSVRDRFGGLEPEEMSRRFRKARGETSSFGGCSDVKPTRKSTPRRLFLSSLAKEADLPIGPVRRVSLKEQLRK